MKIADTARLGWKFMPKFSWIVALFIGVAVYGFVVVCSALIVLNGEKSQPLELQISGENITDATIVKLGEISEIQDVSPVILSNSTLKYGEFTGDFTVTGVDSTYIEGLINRGSVFAQNTAMPYFVMNTAALKTFTNSVITDANYLYSDDESQRRDTSAEEIDWFEHNVEVGDDGRIIGKICGIIEDESETPIVYLSVNSAKNIFSHEYTGAVARIISSGFESEATSAISELNLFVENANSEQIEHWEKRENEVLYLFLSALCLIICLGFILYMRTKISKIIRKDELLTMQICGVSQNTISNIFRLSVCYQIVMGIILGIILALCVPSFISVEEVNSIFSL